MKFTTFATLVRYKTQTNSTTFTDTEILNLANAIKDDMAEKIGKEVGEDYFGLRFTRDLVADQREYELPAELMGRIKYIEAKLDGTNWVKLDETDLLQYQKPTNESMIIEKYGDLDPAFDLWDRSFIIYSGDAIINVTDGLKLWAIIYPADFTDLTSTDDMSTNPTTTSHGFPREFHNSLVTAVSMAYKSSQTRPIPLSKEEQNFDNDFDDKINDLKGKNLDRNFKPTVPYNDGSQY